MVTARESRAALELVSTAAVATTSRLLVSLSGSPELQRAALLEAVPEIIAYYSEGSAALAVDFYDEERLRAGVTSSFATEFVVADRTVAIRRGVVWGADPLFEGDVETANSRLAEVVQLESARPYRDTILGNQKRDPAAVGWRRIANPGACKFCVMVASKGAIYKRDTATFAAHGGCHCSAQPVFGPNEYGPEATALQYTASKRRRTPAEKQALREYLNGVPD